MTTITTLNELDSGSVSRGVINTNFENLNIGKAESSSVSSHISNINNPHSVTKAQVGLSNVDNTSDINKPISTATQTEIDTKQDTLISGANIKSINGSSILGSGDLTITAISPVDSVNGQTGVIVLDTGDILEVADKNYVTDAEKTKLTNTSGTNSGDETTATIRTKLGITTLSGSNTGDQTDITGNAGTVTTINGKISAGTNITTTGTGTNADPYVINATGGGGSGDMLKSIYDTNNDGIVDEAEVITNQGDLATLDQVDTAQIVNHAVGNTQLVQMNANTYKGRESGNGTPQNISTKTAFNKDFGTTAGTVLEGSNDANYVKPTATQTLTNKDLTSGTNTFPAFNIDTPTQSYTRYIRCILASTTNIASISGLLTIDGQALVAGDYILVKNQTTASQNGVYVVSAGAWTRATEYSTTNDFNTKDIFITSGTVNTGTWYACYTKNPVIGTTSTVFSLMATTIGTASDTAAAGNHTHTSIDTTSASSFGSAISHRYTNRTATATGANTDNIVVFSGSTPAQIETMPAGTAVSNNSGRVITYRNNASVSWTIRQSASNTIDGSSADLTILPGETLTCYNTALNTWITINNVSSSTNALKSATTTVNVSSATAPTTGQILTATSPTTATWQTPSGGTQYPKLVYSSSSTFSTVANNVYSIAHGISGITSTDIQNQKYSVLIMGDGKDMGWSYTYSSLTYFGFYIYWASTVYYNYDCIFDATNMRFTAKIGATYTKVYIIQNY